MWPDQLLSCVGTRALEKSGATCIVSTGLSSQIFNLSKAHICRFTGSRHIFPPLNHYPLFDGSCSSQKRKAVLVRLCIAMSFNHLNQLYNGLLCSNLSWERFLPGSQVLMPAFQLWPKLGICWLCPTLNGTIEWTSLESIICPELGIGFGLLDNNDLCTPFTMTRTSGRCTLEVEEAMLREIGKNNSLE